VTVLINLDRLKKNIEVLAAIGRTPNGGIFRSAFGAEDRKAKSWLLDKIGAAGLVGRTDEAGNVWGRLGPQTGPVVMAGSHIDTVPDGGMFDGALGVLAALECLQTIRENGLDHQRAVEMVAFSDEEGAFLSFLGSRAATGTLDPAELANAVNVNHQSLEQALAAGGLDIDRVCNAARDPREIKAYLELHIEQGPLLENQKVSIGLARSIVGIVNYWVRFRGQADHAGTTPLDLRKDALLGAVEFIRSADHWVRSETQSVITIGNLDIRPGAFNIVPALVRLAVEFRDGSAEQLEKIESRLLETGREIASNRGLAFEAERISKDAPVRLSPSVSSILEAEAAALGYNLRHMDSGAGHDAQVMAQKTETGLIFIPSLGGRSHCPEENSRWEDVEKGAQLLLQGLIKLMNPSQTANGE